MNSSISAAILASKAMMAGSHASPLEYTIQLSPDFSQLPRFASRPSSRLRGRVAQNQHQRRKDARRSNAAGRKNAYSAK